ncbi:PD-(D/E)XK nuclease family protein [Candidatus Kaiserbacteria bacterium]|nr:PD-(D/E)XK nuclease family protein [Candidatus Kaiserbacteria bacterium]
MQPHARFKRTSTVFDPKGTAPLPVSRSKIDLFTECPRCFYLDLRLGVKRPSLPGFTLNLAVDHLLKKEFDVYRKNRSAHPLMKKHGVAAIPFEHADLEKWRTNFTGIRVLHAPTNLTVFGAVDDIWVNKKGELHVVDYKATSKKETPSLEGRWGEQYKRQVEVYQWLLRQKGFTVSNTAYFVYVNGRKNEKALDGKLEFDVDLIAHEGDASWVEKRLFDIKQTLESGDIPSAGELCEHCPYRDNAGKMFRKHLEESPKKKSAKGQKGLF